MTNESHALEVNEGSMTRDSRTSPFRSVQAAPADPILGVKAAFRADPSAEKVDLSSGVYQNAFGATSSLECVREAEKRLYEKGQGRDAKADNSADYLPIEGHRGYLAHVQKLLFGADASVIAEGRLATVQSVGGTSALRYGADLLRQVLQPETSGAKVLVSDPTWANHRGVFERVGFKVETYPYYGKDNKLAFDALLERLASLSGSHVVLLHTCCHNPTGLDLSKDQWRVLAGVFRASNLVPFMDFAYQGFAKGLEEDAWPIRHFVEAGVPCLVANSFSKNFSLYNRRVGALTVVCESSDEAQRVLSQLKKVVREDNSNPPRDGAEIVDTILSDPALRSQWENEVTGMRERIAGMRTKFLDGLAAKGLGDRFAHVREQYGMFSYTGLSKDIVHKLRDEHHLYIVDSGRVCIASMTDKNVPVIVDAIAKALGN